MRTVGVVSEKERHREPLSLCLQCIHLAFNRADWKMFVSRFSVAEGPSVSDMLVKAGSEINTLHGKVRSMLSLCYILMSFISLLPSSAVCLCRRFIHTQTHIHTRRHTLTLITWCIHVQLINSEMYIQWAAKVVENRKVSFFVVVLLTSFSWSFTVYF